MIESSSKTKDKGTSKVVAISGIGILVGLMVVASVGIMMSFTAPGVDAEPVAQTTFDEQSDTVDVKFDDAIRIDSASIKIQYEDTTDVKTIQDINSGSIVTVPIEKSDNNMKITVYGTNGENTRHLQSYVVD